MARQLHQQRVQPDELWPVLDPKLVEFLERRYPPIPFCAGDDKDEALSYGGHVLLVQEMRRELLNQRAGTQFDPSEADLDGEGYTAPTI